MYSPARPDVVCDKFTSATNLLLRVIIGVYQVVQIKLRLLQILQAVLMVESPDILYQISLHIVFVIFTER